MTPRLFAPLAASCFLVGLAGSATAQPRFQPPPPHPPPAPVYHPPTTYTPPAQTYRPPTQTFPSPTQQMNQMRTDRAIQDNLRNVTQMQQQTAQRNQAINRTLDQNRQFQEQLWRTQDMARRANDQAERDRQMQRNQTDYSRRYDGANSPASAGNAAGPPANPVLPARVPVFAPVAGAAFNVLNAEDRAASRFDLAMRLADAGKLEKARERCEEIIADHPNTRGAAIAKEYLEKTGN